MTMTAHEQKLAALERSLAIRKRRAGLRAELRRLPQAEARAVLADAIATSPDWLASSNVDQLLDWLPRVSHTTVEGWLEEAELFEHRALRRVTERQRRLLHDLLLGATSTTGRGADG